MTYRQDLHDLLQPAVETEGFELYGLQLFNQGKHSILRIYIDHPEGITVDNCADVSRQVSAVLDVEDPIAGEYILEVSSPGVDRPLFIAEHYRKAMGKNVQITLHKMFEQRKKFSGVITQVDDDEVTVQCDDREFALPMSDVAKAHLVVNF